MSREQFRYVSLLDGASIADEDQSGSIEYFGYTRPGGSWIVLRHNASTGKYDYSLGKDLDRSLTKYDTAWTNRATIGYLRAGNLKAL